MRRAMRCPVTIKMRMGIMDDKPIAAKLIRQVCITHYGAAPVAT